MPYSLRKPAKAVTRFDVTRYPRDSSKQSSSFRTGGTRACTMLPFRSVATVGPRQPNLAPGPTWNADAHGSFGVRISRSTFCSHFCAPARAVAMKVRGARGLRCCRGQFSGHQNPQVANVWDRRSKISLLQSLHPHSSGLVVWAVLEGVMVRLSWNMPSLC